MSTSRISPQLLQARLEDAIGAADTLVVTKRWDGLDDLGRMVGPDQRVVDLVGLEDAGVAGRDRYVGIGW